MYVSLFSSTKKLSKMKILHDFSTEDHSSGPSHFGMYLTPDKGESDYFSLIKSGSVRQSINVADELIRTISVIAHAEFQKVLKIDKNCHVFL